MPSVRLNIRNSTPGRGRAPDDQPETSGAVTILIVLILVQLVVAHSLGLYPQITAIDFYQYWGVPAARRLSNHALGTPYTDGDRYSALLRDQAAGSDQPKFVAASRFWAAPDFAASPLLYALFAVFPSNYTHALVLFHTLQVVAFVVAVVLLTRLYQYERFIGLCLVLLLVLASGPLSSDLRVGNLGSLQLFLLTVLLAVADRLSHAPRPLLATAHGTALLVGLALLALAKPNIALLAVVMTAHLWISQGSRVFAMAAAPTVVASAALVIAPCLYFRSWTVWSEWYRFVYGSKPYMLVRPIIQGNYSTPLLLSTWLGADIWTVASGIALALLVSAMAAVGIPVFRSTRVSTSSVALARATLTRGLADPRFAMAIGITATVAISPLFWYHYALLALIPGLWLLNAARECWALPFFGLTALVLSTGPLNVVFLPLGWTWFAVAAAALSWLPLWCGILIQIYSYSSNAGMPGTAGQASGEAGVTGTGPRRTTERSRDQQRRTD